MGKRIREMRESAGMTYAELATAAGISRGYVYRMETGKQNASIRSIARIAVALSTTISALLEGVDADPTTLGTRSYVWRDGSDPRDPGRPLGRRRQRAAVKDGAPE
jgi:transcriptional regulator with XRE-family HTH domain